jgi:hypothetical protein
MHKLRRTSQKTHYVSATEPSRFLLFRETVAVYCENRTEHTDTLCGQNAQFFKVKACGTYSYHSASNGYTFAPSTFIQHFSSDSSIGGNVY